MDVDKLHSEYRSTYRWHEYTPKQNQVVRTAPQPVNGSGIDGSEFSRKKKHPNVAYRSHELFDMTAPRGAMEGGQDGVRVPRPVARQNASLQRRSQSEGPITRNPLFQSEYRLQFAPAVGRQKKEEGIKGTQEIGQAQEPKLNVSFPPPAPSSGWNRRQNSLRAREMTDAREPKKSVSMGQIQATGNAPASAVETKVGRKNGDINGNMDSVEVPSGGQTPRSVSPATKIKEHKSEYKNRFRPFSQYEYIGDGKFFNTSTSPPNEIDNPTAKFPLKHRNERTQHLSGEPWYQEVIELRKQANDYKCRGWGTDLVPPHMSQIYNQQMNLHEQAARRESLSALALAISTPRSMNKDEKEKENLRKSSSPMKPRSSRPRTAPPKGFKKTTSRSESARPSPTPAKESSKSDPTAKDVKESKHAGRSVSAGSPGRLPSAEQAQGGWKVHLASDSSRPHSAKRQRPTTLNTSTPKSKTSTKTTKKDEHKKQLMKADGSSKTVKDVKPNVSKEIPKRISPQKPVLLKEVAAKPSAEVKKHSNSEAKDRVGEAKKGISRNSSKATSRDTSRPPSAIENHIDYFREPVVKSPPEPTRVKSPEQLLMRSPDPINWTVPLDTGKTFQVTQSVRDSDSARNSPMSDHSSHFDSVSGTAINLGMHSVNEKGSLHYPKVSALAREAKELQGKTSQKKDDKVEKATVSEGNAEIPAAPQDETPNCTAIESESSGYVTASSATARVNGTTEPSTNGEEKEQKDKNDNKTAPTKPNETGKQTTNLKCLEDPTFSFDEPKPSSVSSKPTVDTTANPSDSKPAESGPPKKPSYRVLEDPELDMPKPKGSPYKVLEDPMTASFYEPAKAEGTKGRPEEVADGARQQFDKFFKGNQN